MKTKNSITTISLYELCENNDLLIISTIYHIFILIFNYYAINQLIYLQNSFKDFKKCFDLLQYNIEICQSITIFTLFFIIYFSDQILIKNIKSSNRPIYIMSFSYASKMIIFIYQYQYFDDKNICFNNDSKPDFGVFYALIDISYILRITVFFVSCFLLVGIPIVVTCDLECKQLIEWSKKYKIEFIQKNTNNGSEDI